MAGPATSTQRRWRDRLTLAAVGLLALAPAPGLAEEPLFIRIRPLPDAEAARVARDLLWARRQAHARAVIESVCSGCLGAWTGETAGPPAAPPGRAADRIANLTVPTGVEPDPGSGASDPLPDPPTSERHP